MSKVERDLVMRLGAHGSHPLFVSGQRRAMHAQGPRPFHSVPSINAYNAPQLPPTQPHPAYLRTDHRP